MTLGRLGLAMAALAGYSAGAAVAARGRSVPRLLDLVLAFGCALAAAVLAPPEGASRWRARAPVPGTLDHARRQS